MNDYVQGRVWLGVISSYAKLNALPNQATNFLHCCLIDIGTNRIFLKTSHKMVSLHSILR